MMYKIWQVFSTGIYKNDGLGLTRCVYEIQSIPSDSRAILGVGTGCDMGIMLCALLEYLAVQRTDRSSYVGC